MVYSESCAQLRVVNIIFEIPGHDLTPKAIIVQ